MIMVLVLTVYTRFSKGQRSTGYESCERCMQMTKEGQGELVFGTLGNTLLRGHDTELQL